MKKTLLFLLFAAVIGTNFIYGQANSLVEAPLNVLSANANRAPNGSGNHPFFRACYLVRQPELINIPVGTGITSFGFTLNVGVTGSAVSGNFTVYLQNTGDLTYQKGTTFATALSGMTSVYASVMTIPVSATTNSILVTLSSTFTYTGGGLYVAYDWDSVGPFSGTSATYLGEAAAMPLPSGAGAVAYNTLSAPTTLTLTASRPSFLFGFPNPNSNDIQVLAVEAPGKVTAPFTAPYYAKAYVRNASTVAQTNFNVTLSVSGANFTSSNVAVSNLAAGAYTWVTFPAYTPTVLGLNTVSVSVGNDQNNLNNSAVYMQSVTCNEWALNPATSGYTVNALGFNGATGIIATTYTPPIATSLIGLRGAIGTSTNCLNQPVCGVILNNAGLILATTNTITITNAMLGTFQSFSLAAPQTLTAGSTYYIGFMQLTISSFPAGAIAPYYMSGYPYYYSGLGGGIMTQLTVNYGYLGIEAILSNEQALPVTATPSAICSGACSSLTVNGISNVIWNTGSFGPGITVCPTVAATYTAMGISPFGCPASTTIGVTVNQLPAITIAAQATDVCVGGPATFTANGGTTFAWANGPNTAVYTASPNVNSSYTVTGTDANGCSSMASIDVNVLTLTVSVSSNTTVCSGKSANLSASGAGNYNYNWSIGQGFPFANANVSPTVTTVYTLTTTDQANGCTQANTVTVTVNANPTVMANSSASVICKGHTATLTANGASTYSWTNNGGSAASITIAPQFNATYTVTGTNASGCTHTASVLQIVDACLAIGENTASGDLRVYPNPTSGKITVQTEQEGARTLSVFHCNGRLVLEITTTSLVTEIDLSDRAHGVYLLQIRSDEGLQTRKILLH